jgi:hypothetical protein
MQTGSSALVLAVVIEVAKYRPKTKEWLNPPWKTGIFPELMRQEWRICVGLMA